MLPAFFLLGFENLFQVPAGGVFGNADAGDDEGGGDHVEGFERFPKHQDGEQGAENRNQIDEQTAAVGADQLDPLRIGHLGDDRGEERYVEDDQPALDAHRRDVGGEARKAGGKQHLIDDGGQGGEKAGGRDEADPADLRLVAQQERMEGVKERGEQHQRIAEIDVEADEPHGHAVGGDVDDAIDGDDHADDVERRGADAEDEEIADHDEDRNGGLDHGDVDGGGEGGRAVEEGVEGHEPDHAVKGQPAHAAPDLGPFAPA